MARQGFTCGVASLLGLLGKASSSLGEEDFFSQRDYFAQLLGRERKMN